VSTIAINNPTTAVFLRKAWMLKTTWTTATAGRQAKAGTPWTAEHWEQQGWQMHGSRFDSIIKESNSSWVVCNSTIEALATSTKISIKWIWPFKGTLEVFTRSLMVFADLVIKAL
jgi:hypothetical protein